MYSFLFEMSYFYPIYAFIQQYRGFTELRPEPLASLSSFSQYLLSP